MNLRNRLMKIEQEKQQESFDQYAYYIEGGKPVIYEENRFTQLPSKTKFILDLIALVILILIGRWLLIDVISDFLLGCIFQFTNMNVFWIDRTITTILQILYFGYALAIVGPIVKNRYQNLKNQEAQNGLIQDVCTNWNKNELFSTRLNDPNPWKTIARKFLLYLIGIPCMCLFIATSVGMILFIAFCVIYHIFSFGLLLTGIGLLFFSTLLTLLIVRYWPKGCETHA